MVDSLFFRPARTALCAENGLAYGNFRILVPAKAPIRVGGFVEKDGASGLRFYSQNFAGVLNQTRIISQVLAPLVIQKRSRARLALELGNPGEQRLNFFDLEDVWNPSKAGINS